ncbi:MAG: alpha-glucosidase [Clostridia bacterium]
MDYKRMTIYQIYPRSFCDSNGDGIGDIKGIISKLDYIKQLGVDAIWFSPLYCSPNADYGYDISDYKNINSEYGDMQDFDLLLEEMHKRNLKCIMDLVINHTSSSHEWFKQSRSSLTNPYRNYYIWAKGRGKDGKKPPNNWTSFFIGKAWEYDETTKEWYLHLFDACQPDLNYSNPAVKQEIKDILKFWLDKGVDGFRCDVINIIAKAKGLPNGKANIALVGKEHYLNQPELYNILRELRNDVLDKYDTYTVGESVLINVEDAIKLTDKNAPLLNTVFAFEQMSADNYFGVKQLKRKFSLKYLKNAHKHWQNGLFDKGWNTNYFENHDQARIVGRYCLDNAKYRELGSKMLANVMFFLSGTPYVYQGQEIGMTSVRMQNIDDYKDVESHRSYKLLHKFLTKKLTMKLVAYSSRDNARTPMQWNSSKQGGFSSSDTTWLKVNPNYKEINVKSQIDKQTSPLNYYKRLIALRKTHDEMIFGTYSLINIGGNKLYAYLREFEGKRLVVISNFTVKDYKFKATKLGLTYASSKLFISNYPDSSPYLCSCKLRAYESVVYELLDK